MKHLVAYILAGTIFCLSSCTSEQIASASSVLLGGGDSLTEAEAGSGLRAALTKGISIGADLASKQDGFFKNSLIKIPFPPEAVKVANTLRDVGLGAQVDKVILSLNRAAEDAAKEAKPIFISAIKEMTLIDAMNILFGEDDAATQYLKDKTSSKLTAKFTPVITASLDKVNAVQYWNTAMTSYNKIPFVKKMNPDLTEYVTDRALDGLFLMVAKEEEKIRESPVARTTSLLRKVFGYRDRHKDD